MKIKVKKGVLSGKASAPPSKSMTHRCLICAGLSEDESKIENISFSEDILATLDCLETIGAKIKKGEGYVKIKGVSPRCIPEEKIFNVRESASTLRFFIPIALLSDGCHSFILDGRLPERPMDVYEEICGDKGLLFLKKGGKIKVKGELTGGNYTVRGDISSQFVSGLLFALPLCDTDSVLRLTGDIESRSYIEMTVDALRKFGIDIIWNDDRTIYIRGSQKYKGQTLTVEGDYSNTAVLDAFNLIGGKVEIVGLEKETLQGDRVYKDYFRRLDEGSPVLDVSDCPDLAPILMTLAAIKNGAVLKGTRRLSLKESSRGEAMKTELSEFGADITLKENEIVIEKSPLHKSCKALSGHNDHRIVMALTVISSLYGGEIEGAEAVNKSYPDFFEVINSLQKNTD